MGKPFIDITGRMFHSWTVIEYAGQNRWGHSMWLCRCRCGTEASVGAKDLRSGRHNQCRRCAVTKHGHGKYGRQRTPSYMVWQSMRERCNNTESISYDRYGGRGISVCDRWNDFSAFLADMGERPSLSHTIDRVNNDGNYEPGNCRWATAAEQATNRSDNRMLTHDGKTMCVSEWAIAIGVPHYIIRNRLRIGWSVDRTLSVRPKPRGSSLTDATRERIVSMIRRGASVQDVAASVGRSLSAVYRTISSRTY